MKFELNQINKTIEIIEGIVVDHSEPFCEVTIAIKTTDGHFDTEDEMLDYILNKLNEVVDC